MFLVGCFLLREVSSGDEKGIDFYQRGCLRLWCFLSSVLEVAKKYIIAESIFLRHWRYGGVFQKKFDLPAAGKNRWIVAVAFKKGVFTAARKNRSIFNVVFKSRSAFSMAKKNILCEFVFQMCRSCSPSSLIRHSQSSRWFFSVVLLEDVIVEDWGGFQNSSPFLGKTRGLLLWPNFNHWSRENAGAEVTIFFLSAGMLQRRFLHSGVGWIPYPDGVE